MIPMKSKVDKIVIYVKTNPTTDQLIEIIILRMKGVRVTSMYLGGPSIDANNPQGIISDIAETETDEKYLDTTKVTFLFQRLGDRAIDHLSEVYDIVERLFDDNVEHIIYNDNNNSDELFQDLCDYTEQYNEELLPTHFGDIYPVDHSIVTLLDRLDVQDPIYTPESSVMTAVYTGILFDIGLGKSD